jgi:peptidoglycan/xylan/chitin deacetylase (PgdA/CDA1 family)
LRLFTAYHVHATWATVGFLFFKDIADLSKSIPDLLPTYHRQKLSPYKYASETPYLDPEYHFAPDLIDLIREHDGQEIGTHTFSHYYCLEEGQSVAQFEADLLAALEVAKRRGISIISLVFPRNQWNADYLSTLHKLGVRCYRGNESSWMYDASNDAGQGKLQRACRFVDAYLNLSGYHTYRLEDCIREPPFNFPASRFLRPYSARLAILDGWRLRRITNAMADAAATKRLFHLWWHPHNFGSDTQRNVEFLCRILEHYKRLRCRYGMVSLNMGELSLLSEGRFAG